jgi:ATP synthase protein I
MTTTTRPAQGQPRSRTPQVLLLAGVCVAVAVVLTTLVAALAGDGADALGALSGGSLALCFFLSGALVVEMASRLAPQASMLVALMTYALQVTLVLLVFVVLRSSGALDSALTPGWLAAGVIVATAAWTVGLLVASARARVPAYDIELPEPTHTAAGPTSPGLPGPPSQAREVGAP